MRITLLGTGDAGGTPRHGCDCAACKSLVRTPSHALVESETGRLALDAGIELPPDEVDAVLLTHFHLDHVVGLLPRRYGVGAPLTVYAPHDEASLEFLFKERGGLDFRHPDGPLTVAGYEITPVPLRHSVPTCGWLVRQDGACLAYLTDTKGIPEASRELLREAEPDLMVLDCTWPPGADPDNHNDLNLALYEVDEIAPKRTVLIHLSHELDLWRLEDRGELPPGVEFGRDGQSLAVV